jgi:periplasmic divalent cation tolerance protein
MASDTGMIVVLTNLPDRASALSLARHLVQDKLAACVNVLEGCTSVYAWESKIETEPEIPVLIKTRKELLPELHEAIRARHPYAVPEIVALPIVAGLPEYLSWLAAETRQ